MPDKIQKGTLFIFAVLFGSLLLFGTWDAESTLVGVVLAGAALFYLSRYSFPDGPWNS